MTTTTYMIPAEAKAAFDKVFARAVRKATKLGVPALTATFGKPVTREILRKGRPTGRFVTDLPVTITGENPSLNGWKLTGIITPLKTDDGSILPLVTTVPGETVSDDTRNTSDPLKCDHCGARRDRLETFVVTHENGTEKQVGRQCLADFLGGAAQNSPAALASLAGLRTDLDNEVKALGNFTRSFYSDSLETVFACTLAVIRKHGWVPTSKARMTYEIATRTHVGESMDALACKPNPDNFDTNEQFVQALAIWTHETSLRAPQLPTFADYDQAREILEHLNVWFDQQLDNGALNDYLASCRIILGARAANRKAMGIACSMVPLALKEMGLMDRVDPVLAKLLEAKKVSTYIGTIGKRETFKALFIERLPTNFGSVSTFLVGTNIVKTFTAVGNLKAGDEVTIKATPQRHSEFRGVRETVMNRVVVA
jgi:hypothetical protein